MFRKATLIGIGSHVAIVATGFMLLAGSSDLPSLTRFSAMGLASVWAGVLLLAMLIAYRTWPDCTTGRRLGLFALALPGWTIGLPVVMLYFLRSSDDFDGVTLAE